MEINPEVFEILREYKIDKSQGLLCLLGVYYKLDVNTTCSEETIKAINLTKIVDRDYERNTIVWNIPLFSGQQTEWDWVKDWIDGFKRINPDRRGSGTDAVRRMQEFFRKYPKYRMEDIYKARDLYFKSVAGTPLYCMHSHKFIFDGMGAMKKSRLLEYCEKVYEGQSTNNIKGQILT